MVYNKYTTEENKYLKLLKHVLESGEQRMDRTSTGTLSVFGPQIEFDVSVFFPLLTTKKLNFRNILTEVLWFISGSTNTKYLLENGVNVWNGNTTREFLDKRGLKDYEVGDTGPLYGYQWRHYGGDFKDPESKGVDQLNRMLYILKTEPTSRRIFMSAWNPLDLDKMVLEPCHVSFQLYVEGGKYLNGKLYMRSNDMFLGAPWNIAGYTILLYIFCHLSGYKPGKLIYSIGDCHIYNDHIKQVETQLKRPMRPLPVLIIVKQCSTFEDFDADCFMLENYSPQSAIVGKISA
jgi:thymidylate synthase